MPDSKITALTSISTSTDPANDPLVIVDVSDTSMAATGTTKKVTLNQLLGASGTATLASATITGDLTVDTNTLKVDSANDRVGVGTTTPSQKLEVATLGSDTRLRINSTSVVATEYFRSGTGLWLVGSDSTNAFKIARGSNFGGSADYFSIGSATADCTWFDTAGGTRMTLNATGLGVGVASPAYKGDFNGNIRSMKQGGRTDLAFLIDGNASPAWQQRNVLGHYYNGAQDCISLRVPSSATPNTGSYDIGANGTHSWYSAAGTTATGSTGTPTMTLDASGNLLVGTTGLNGSWNTKLTLSNDSGTTKWAVGPYLGGVTNFLISAGASAGVYLNGTAATSWTSASDERLKDIIEPISNAVAKVGSLRAVIGKFKFDENNTRKPFLIAQDIQAVLPEAVDASNPEKLGVAYTDVIPLLVAAIKELTARVQTLETR